MTGTDTPEVPQAVIETSAFRPHSVVLIISKYTRDGEHEEPVLLIIMTALSPETGRLHNIALGMGRHRTLKSPPCEIKARTLIPFQDQ